MRRVRRASLHAGIACLSAWFVGTACSPSKPAAGDDDSGNGGSGAVSGTAGAPLGGTANGGTANGGTATGGTATGGTATGGTTGIGGTSPATGGLAGTGPGGAAGLGGTSIGGAAGVPGAGAGGADAGQGGTAAGSGGASGAAGSGGKSGTPTCASLTLCDDFESTAVGAAPNPALWTKIPSSAAGSATVDSIGAHGSGRSLKVVSPDRLYLRNTTVIGTLGAVVHVRYYVRLMTTLAQGHGAMIVTHPTMVDQYSQSNELRFGSQDMVFHWNTDSDAANIPDVSPMGDALSFHPEANTWYCVELTINTNGHLNVSIDGADQAGLTADGVGTANIDQQWFTGTQSTMRYTALADFNFGWQSYGSGAMTAWFDDVALSASPIGCQ